MNYQNVLLIYPGPDEIKSYRFGYSLLLLYIASDLRSHGHNVSIADYSVLSYSAEDLAERCASADACIIELDAFPLKRAVNFRNGETVARDIKKINPEILTIAAGKQCSLSKTAFDSFDLVISGDTEVYFSEMFEKDEPVPDSKFISAGTLESLACLPMPAWDLLTMEQICGRTSTHNMHLKPSALFETSRGCPGKCTFCQRHGWRDRVLTLPLDAIEERFRYLLEHGIRNVWIADDNFASNLDFAKSVLRVFSRLNNGQIKISLSAWVHIDTEFLDLAKAAGVSVISFGIDTTSIKSQSFYRKRINLDKLADTLGYADRLGIYTVGNFIIGSPFDTEESVMDDLDFAIKSPLDVINVKRLDYMNGSALFETLPESCRNEIHVFASQENGLCALPDSEIKRLSKKFAQEFNRTRARKILSKIEKFGPPYYKE